MKSNNSNPKLITFINPSHLQKPLSSPRWVLALVSFFVVAFLVTLIHTREPEHSSALTQVPAASLPDTVVSTLLHYVSRSNDTYHMSHGDLKMVSEVLRKCAAPCSMLVFGLTHETLLWEALNHNGRTVFIDGNRYYAEYVEEMHPEIDAYDVQYTTKVNDTAELIATAKEQVHNECRPVQNLLFSDCQLGLNDLPNMVYDVAWDVVLVDGPRGDRADAPGRISPIFTAGVLGRSKKGGNPKTHVFLHDYYRDVEKMCGDEFLCRENLVETTDMMAHFVLERAEATAAGFCGNGTTVGS